ncbi:MAG: leucyl aminopeptidase [Gammaproteobacteria bacterium]|nr:leucyl aminopeptidase [Gammaproteobacteria bacterium]|tara:strand:+ start:1443 stop:2807 length:1365 start_codon:yes stop_codon:yes gene_type:complete
MNDVFVTATDEAVTPIRLVRTEALDEFLGSLGDAERRWAERGGFKAKPGQAVWLPDASGAPGRVAVGWDGRDSLSTLGGLPLTLAEGVYQIEGEVTELQLLGWATGAYQFERYRTAERQPARLMLPAAHDGNRLANLAAATTLIRDLINTPAQDMLPSHLAAEADQLAQVQMAECTITEGEALLDRSLFAIHAVGRAATDAPRLIDIRWGDASHPEVVLIGKGVCFDSGGLDLKPASAMRTMKKDMGGAAQVLGLAQLVMAQRLPVRLRVLIPAVENAVAGNAFRPGDVLPTYKGITVEIDNTDAEGRLVLCDAIALAAEESPALIVDFATLTGSARSAVGAEISAMFSNDNAVADAIARAGAAVDDPVWRMPLHRDYNYKLESKVADVVNSASTPYAGAVTAALFLDRFVGEVPWVHFDIMAFNTRYRPGRPEGGEAMAARAVFHYLEQRFGA